MRLARRRDAGLSEREDVGTGKRRGAGASAEVARIEQAVGAIGVVGLGERSAEFAQDDALGERIEIAVAPKARMICDASSARPIACAARAAAILPALDCGGSLAKNAATSAGACGCAASSASCRSRIHAAAWPARMSLRGKRRAMRRTDGRPHATTPIRAPIARRVSGRRGERREARDVALLVEDRGLQKSGRRRQGGVSRRRRGLAGPDGGADGSRAAACAAGGATRRQARQAPAPRPQGRRRRTGPCASLRSGQPRQTAQGRSAVSRRRWKAIEGRPRVAAPASTETAEHREARSASVRAGLGGSGDAPVRRPRNAGKRRRQGPEAGRIARLSWVQSSSRRMDRSW